MNLNPKGFTMVYESKPGDYEYLTEMYFKAKSRVDDKNATKRESDYSAFSGAEATANRIIINQ